MQTQVSESLKTVLKVIGRASFLTSIFGLVLTLFFQLLFWQRVYPNVYVADKNLGGKNYAQVKKELEVLSPPLPLVVASDIKTFTLTEDDISFVWNPEKIAQKALGFGREQSFIKTWENVWVLLTDKVQLDISFELSEEDLDSFIQKISDELSTPAIPTSVSLEKKKVVISKGREGKIVDKTELKRQILANLSRVYNAPILVPTKLVETLSDKEIEKLSARAEKFIDSKIVLLADDKELAITDNELLALLKNEKELKEELLFDLVQKIITFFDRPVHNATFRFDGKRVTEFTPAVVGISTNQEELEKALRIAILAIDQGEKEQKIITPLTRSEPKIKTSDVNNLGIKELIGRGTSRFKGSIASRAHNIALAAARLNGIIIAPGETFSFNDALGDVSIFTGYQQAYIIKDGKTILGDGGGVCQVSSTLFRAALKAGLAVAERRAHSYRVAYYEQDSGPGFDATVYSPTTDLKIKNDTPAHILIQTHADKKNSTLLFELYGTNDGRIATTTKPRVWDQTEPPPDLYQDDPTLPNGVIKQVDFKAWGAKTSFDYQVKRNDETLQKRTFYSVYRPWQAVYLRGIAQ